MLPCIYSTQTPLGNVAEWLKAPVLKTGVQQCIVSSNLTISALYLLQNTGLTPDPSPKERGEMRIQNTGLTPDPSPQEKGEIQICV